jgi:hypothetical protein
MPDFRRRAQVRLNTATIARWLPSRWRRNKCGEDKASAGNNRHRKAMWLCRCDCGTERVVDGRDLRNDHSKSCGMANRLTTAQVAEIRALAGA